MDVTARVSLGLCCPLVVSLSLLAYRFSVAADVIFVNENCVYQAKGQKTMW